MANILCWLTNTIAWYSFLATLIISVCVALFLYWYWKIRSFAGNVEEFFVIKDNELKAQWAGKKVPISYLHEAFFAGKIDRKDNIPLLEILEKREQYSSYTITPEHAKFFFKHVVPEFLIHSASQDRAQVTDHYDRGNDFFEYFLGETMIYTSGLFKDKNDSLEEAQKNKLDNICDKLHIKEGETLLDIGCGWGTLTRHAAKHYKAKATGVTISKEQLAYHKKKCEEDKVEGAELLLMDYREIPQKKYDKISCVEMSEHVGILKYRAFMKQVHELLEDDGLFYLQIAGLRMTTHIEDIIWGFFMDKYIFPGADASLPLTFPISQLERAGFEVQSVKTIGIHYSITINRWYDNWVSNREKIVSNPRYGEKWYRIWEWFLAWSTIIARQGNSTCYQIIAHKNRNEFPRDQWVSNTWI
eukprot:gene4216-7553_t